MSPGARRARGELEASLLHALWSSDEALSAQQLQQRLPGAPAAHTTVLTALERLRAKGEVVRVGEAARGIRFAAARSESDYTGQAMLAQLADSTDRTAALLKFAGSLDAQDVDALRRALGQPRTEES